MPLRSHVRQRRPRRALASIVTGALCLGLAHAALAAEMDVLIRTETRPGSEQTLPTSKSTIWLAPDRLRLEFSAPEQGGPPTIVVFRAEEKTYWLLDPTHRRYAQIDEDAITKLAVRLRQTRAEMAARMEAASPEQRAAMEEMLETMLGPEPGTLPKEDVRMTNRVETVGERKARVSEIVLGEEVVGEAWVVPWKDLEVDRARFDVFRALAAFQRHMFTTLGRFGGVNAGTEPFEVFDLVGGYPLVLRRFEEGRVVSETHFMKLEDVPHDPSRYVVPEGFVRQKGPGDSN